MRVDKRKVLVFYWLPSEDLCIPVFSLCTARGRN